MSDFHGIERYFLPEHHTPEEFCKNMPTGNKICFLSKITGFSYFEALLLSLDKAFLYCFSTYQRAKHIHFKEMIAIFQVITR